MLLRISLVLFFAAISRSFAAPESDCAYDPARTHLSRIVAVDSTHGPVYGQILNEQSDREQSRTLVLKDHEVVLTFDDGPLYPYTNTVLDALDRHCVKATFFSVGRMALANPKLIQEVERRGHTVGTHTWSHPLAMHKLPPEEIKLEIEKGFAAVSHALGKPVSPFFRFPGLRDSSEGIAYLTSRNISTWSVDVVSGDTEPGATPEKITHNAITRIKHLGKGIILFHDIKKITAEAIDGILTDLENNGFKVVQVVSNTYYQANPEMAKTDAFRIVPGSASITGKVTAASKDQGDGNVDVMHTEWLDLKRADEELLKRQGQDETEGTAPTPKPRTNEAQPAAPKARAAAPYASSSSWVAVSSGIHD